MAKTAADLLILHASELLTLDGPNRARRGGEMRHIGTVSDGAVAVKGGKVAACGKTGEISRRFEAGPKNTIDASGKTVMPGFVDAHTHIVFAGSREQELLMKLEGKSYMEILQSGGGIMSTVKATRNATQQELAAQAGKRLDTMMRLGTTTVEAKTGYGLTTHDELKSLDVLLHLQKSQPLDIVPTFMAAHAVPPESKKADDYIDLIIDEMLPKTKWKAAFCDVFCEQGAFTVEQSRKLLLAARMAGLKLKLHADEFVDTNGAALAAELGAISAEHLLASNLAGIKKMAEKDVIGVLLPVSAFSMMMGKYADARAMISENLPIALGTDLCPNSWSESMQFVIQLACYKMRMTPAEAITASTINAAYAIGMGNSVGSLEPGKKADIIIMDAPNHLHIPYRQGTNHVETVIKDGKVIADSAGK